MMRFAIAYLVSLLAFLAIDFVWLTRVARRLYVENLGGLLLDKPRLGAAAAFYLLYGVGIVVFAVMPSLKTGSFSPALLYGGLFGFLAYATYDMTNYATLKNWPFHLALIDMAWGAAVTALSAGAGYLVTRMIVP